MPRSVTFEVCVDSPDGVLAAAAGGAQRLEVCAALGLGGLTPGAGLISAAAKCNIESHAMIRPRAGGFVLRAGDLEAMLADIAAVQEAGLAGVVFGVCQPDGQLDKPTLAALCHAAGPMQTTLHRAFDLTPDPVNALEAAIALGFDRILTSGQAASAPAGAPRLAQLAARAASRIEIMAGGGVTLKDVRALVATGVDAIHSSCSRPDPDHMDCSLIGITAPRITDARSVAAMKAEINQGAIAA